MDFFAKAFIERDIPSNHNEDQESNVVVKDGIQILEKAISNGTDVIKCEVCGVVNAKYKCPGCFSQTCSLKCSKQHKLDTTCTGVRSRTHFVERKQYGEREMMSDYNFLEEVGRSVDNAARDNMKVEQGSNAHRKKMLLSNIHQARGQNSKGRNNNQNRNQDSADGESCSSVGALSLTAAQELERLGSMGTSYKDKQLILQAKKRASHLIMMAEGLQKRKENNTHWRDKPSRIIWTLEWLFPEVIVSGAKAKPRRILVHKNDESKSLKELLTEQLTLEENKDLAEKFPVDMVDQYRLYYVIPLQHANKPALYPLTSKNTIQEALMYKKVLEYPSILVLGPKPNHLKTETTDSSEAKQEDGLSSEDVSMEGSTLDEKKEGANEGSAEDPILARYTIEAPPTEWPKKATPVKNGAKRSNEAEAQEQEQPAAKKSKTKDSNNGVEETLSDDDDDSDDDDEDSSDDDSSSESSSSDDDSSEDEDDDDAMDKKQDDTQEETEDATKKDPDAQDNSEHLKLGQAILEAFNQDFGQERTITE
ncbi:Box C/D snoRNA protein 1 [Podila epigama]|nr:Box C/D snoRNA protein 1 [Podila epigama]